VGYLESMKTSGPVLMILAQVAFTIMVAFVKVARQEMTAFEIAWWRSVVAVPLLMLMYRKIPWRIEDRNTIVLRTVLGFGALCFFFAAAKGLSIADLSLISKLQPLLVAVLAPLLLGKSERASSNIWWLMVLAIIGCSILMAPSLEVGSWYGLLALLASIFSAHAHVFIRRLKNEHPGIVVLWFQSGSGILAFGCCCLFLGGIPMPQPDLWLPLIGVGFMATIGQLLMTSAYKKEKAATVAVASYAGPLIAVIVDGIAFNVFPSWNGYLGGGIVVLSGALLLKVSHSR